MRKHRNMLKGIVCAFAMLMIILDSKTALAGAKDGICLCMQTLIPSLFPFFVLSAVMGSTLSGRKLPILSPLLRASGIPEECGSLFALGAVSGYPVGAQCIYEAYRSDCLSGKDARRMLGFCSNAGPAFIFGVAGQLFTNPAVPWCIWLIHLLSAWITGILLPGKGTANAKVNVKKPVSIPAALEKAIKTMATVCGWVILFRIAIFFCKRWFLWLLPQAVQAAIIGIIELSNGFYEFAQLRGDGLRFILCTGALGFGGLCVGLQTISIVKELGTGYYFPGKLIQCAVSVLLSILVQPLLFQPDAVCKLPMWLYFLSASLAVVLILAGKKVVAIPRRMLYNTEKAG